MYDFRDTTESKKSEWIPSEALFINGLLIENEIQGYRTLTVEGRELSGTEIKNIEVGVADGSKYLNKRYPSRIIKVKFQLVAESNRAFREAFNKLNRLLDVEEAQLIFSDEPDKFFIGTKASVNKIEAGSNSVIGEFDFFCADPFKYSLVEHEETPVLDDNLTFAIAYAGNVPSFPRFEVTHNSDNGFIAFMNDDKAILQFGNPDEADGENYKQNECFYNSDTFVGWIDDKGIDNQDHGHTTQGQLSVIPIGGRNNLTLVDRGLSGYAWNGAMKIFHLPPDSEGVIGAKNFYCYMTHWFETGLMGQTGAQTITFLTEDNKIIGGYIIHKPDMTGNIANITLIGKDGVHYATYQFIPSYLDAHNPFNQHRGQNDFLKEGNSIRFYYWGNYPVVHYAGLENYVCTKIQTWIGQWYNRDLGNQFVTRNYIRDVSFHKFYVEKWRDVPNKFGIGDKLEVNCQNGEVLLKGLKALGLGSLGNDWEKFALKPGMNQIKCAYSNWSDPPPNFKIKYREVFL